MKELVAIGLRSYDGKVLQPGDRFQCADQYVDKLTKAHLARDPEAPDTMTIPQGRAGYVTRELQAGTNKRGPGRPRKVAE